MRTVLEGHGGTIEKIIGDAIVAVFGLPEPKPDDPVRAVAAAAATQQALADLNEALEREWGVQLTTRTGVATGDVVVGEASAGQHVLTGPALQLATAMEQNAPGMGVLLHASTYAEVQAIVEASPVEPFVPKGMDRPVEAYELLGVQASAVGLALTDVSAGGPARSTDLERRKTVTIVFADPRPSTTRDGAITPEALRDVMSAYFEAMRAILERHGGTVEKFIGDAVMAVFGLPVRHEDDALRASRAALDMQAALPALNASFEDGWGITFQSHIGVNTGEVVSGDASLGQRLVTGDAVNVAARLEQAAHAHEVLIGDLTYRLVRDHVEVEPVEPLTLKGKAEPVPAFRLLAVKDARATGHGEEAPLIGRDQEMAELQRAMDEIIRDRQAGVMTFVGDAGVGKTRLVRDFLSAAERDATVLRGRCLPYGDGITFWPLIEVVREAAGVRDDDSPEMALERLVAAVGGDLDVADRVASVLGLSSTGYQVAELFWGARRFVEHLASVRPLVVLFDDVHWAEQTFLDLIDHLTGDAARFPVLILCTARMELLERYPDWGSGTTARRFVLGPLSDADAGLVIEHLLGDVGLADDARDRIVSASEGNPLFVEQLLSMLVDSGRLRRGPKGWEATQDLAVLAIPPTIHALLAARLDALPLDERSVLEPASVIGLMFPQDAVEALVGDPAASEVPTRLGDLARKELVHAQPDAPDDDRLYRFHHLLVRDAAYQGLLKRSRAVLHERFVAWADVVNAERGRTTEFEEILGYHLEQAYRYRSQLGPLDDAGARLGARAAERLGAAGRRAFARGDMPAAASLLGRAAAVLPEGDAQRSRLLILTAEARLELGEFAEAGEHLDAAIETAVAAGDQAAEATARIERLRLRHVTGSADVAGHVAEQVRELIAALEAAGDQAGLARAWRLLTYVEMDAERWNAAERTATRVLEHAKRAGDRAMELRMLPALAHTARYGSMTVEAAVRRCEELLERAAGDRRAETAIRRTVAALQALDGDFETARTLYRASRATLLDLGWRFGAALVSIDSGPIEMLAGDPAAAEAELRRDYETLQAMDEHNFITTTAAYLAHALYRLGRFEEASSFATFSAEAAAEDDVATQYLWRSVRAKLLARDGQAEAAIAMALEALRLARTSDDPIGQADTLVDLAVTQQLCGRDDEAAAALAEAIVGYERKGSPASVERARLLVAEASVSRAGPAASDRHR